MSSDQFSATSRLFAAARSRSVVLSPWVNERFPAWEQLLSAHDVARLTRRPRWVLYSMMVLGRFPRKRRHQGHGIGWLRSDVVHWLAKDFPAGPCHKEPSPFSRRRHTQQASLPLEFTTSCGARKSRGSCSLDRR